MKLTDRQRTALTERIRAGKAWTDERFKLNDADSFNTDYQTEYARNLALLRGSYWADQGNDLERSVNHIAPALRVKHTVVSGGKTVFIAKARSSRWISMQDTAKGLLNHLWDSLDFDRQCDQCEWDAYAYGFGVAEIGWAYKYKSIEARGSRPDEMAVAEEAIKNGDNAPFDAAFAETATEYPDAQTAQAVGEIPAFEAEIDEPFIERFSPADLIVDPACTTYTLSNARYVFRRKLLLVSDVKRNSHYSNTKDIKGNAWGYWAMRDDTQQEPPSDATDDIMYTVIYDGYTYLDSNGKNSTKLHHVVWCGETDQELLVEECPYDFKKAANPFVFEIIPAFVADNDRFQPVADVSAVRDIQISHDESFTQVEYQRSHSPNVLIVPKGTFEEDDGEETKRRIEEGVENTIVEVNQAFIGSVKWLERPMLRQEAYQELSSTQNRIMEHVGVSDFQANMTPDKQMTATESTNIANQGGTRQESEIERYEDFLRRMAYKILTLCQQFAETPKEFAWTDSAGETQWGKASMRDLRLPVPGGDIEESGIQFAIEIDPSRRRSRNEFLEKQESMQLLSTLMPFTQMPDPRLPTRQLIDIVPLVRGVVEKFDLPNQTEIIKPDPTPEEMQQAQMQQMQAQNGNIVGILGQVADVLGIPDNVMAQALQVVEGQQGSSQAQRPPATSQGGLPEPQGAQMPNMGQIQNNMIGG